MVSLFVLVSHIFVGRLAQSQPVSELRNVRAQSACKQEEINDYEKEEEGEEEGNNEAQGDE